jgi:calcium binding protein 39
MTSNTAQDSSDVALNSGMMLRECIKHEALAKIILFSDLFYKAC